MNCDLFTWRNTPDLVEPWQPTPLDRDQWPPDYKAVYAWRLKQIAIIRSSPAMIASAKAYYSTRPVEFIMHWVDTYNPRKRCNKWVPFIFFPKQVELIELFHEMREIGESALVEKCRDAGATWGACGYSVWSWLFIQQDAIGWGSRKQELVDRLGNPDSIFEKMRLIIKRLPDFFIPVGFNPTKHATFMKLLNPENGSIVSGEAGDNIGRGGRNSMYFKDESAHYAHPEAVEAALGDNTNTQIDISSVNGPNNVFHRRREAGVEWQKGKEIEAGFVRVFIIDWRDHPEKNQEWYNMKRAKAEREGLLHVFAQEVDRNYSAAVLGTIIPDEYIKAAIDAHLHIPGMEDGGDMAGLDVADEGLDRNGWARRKGVVLRAAREWSERDPGVTTRNVVSECRDFPGISVQYDSIGIGAAVKAEYNRLIEDKTVKQSIVKLVPWNAGSSVKNPVDRIIPDDDGSAYNKDFFQNLKAQAWWSLRTRFYKTWRMRKGDAKYPIQELISIDGQIPALHQITKELTQPTQSRSSQLRMIVDKKPDGTKSPNIADAIVMCYFPVDDTQGRAVQGIYSNG